MWQQRPCEAPVSADLRKSAYKVLIRPRSVMGQRCQTKMLSKKTEIPKRTVAESLLNLQHLKQKHSKWNLIDSEIHTSNPRTHLYSTQSSSELSLRGARPTPCLPADSVFIAPHNLAALLRF